MTPKHLKTKPVDRMSFGVYRAKADDFYETMLSAVSNGKWTAVGLNAVHCAISSCDALLVYYLGLRSIGEDHLAVTDLLSDIPRGIISKEGINAFTRIIAKKNLIAYENREFRQIEALEIQKLTERFYNKIVSKLPS